MEKLAQSSTRWRKAAQARTRSHKMAQARTKLHKIAQARTRWHKIAQGHTTTSRYQEAFDFSIDFWSMFAPNLNPQVLKTRAPVAARTRLLTNRPSKLTSMFDHMLVPTWNHSGTQESPGHAFWDVLGASWAPLGLVSAAKRRQTQK